jgi:hypothetical protein
MPSLRTAVRVALGAVTLGVPIIAIMAEKNRSEAWSNFQSWLPLLYLAGGLAAIILYTMFVVSLAARRRTAVPAKPAFEDRSAVIRAAKDAAEVSYGLTVTMERIDAADWRDVIKRYEHVRLGMLRLRPFLGSRFDAQRLSQLEHATKKIARFCKAVDLSLISGGELPNPAHAKDSIRKHYDLITAIHDAIERKDD